MYWKAALFFSLLSATANAQIGALVNTTSGVVKGHASTLRPEVSEYLGIRFGKSTAGDLRFAAPVPVERRPGIYNATSFSPDCPCNRIPMKNAYLGGAVGEKISVALSQRDNVLGEDCLALNVWTKPQTGEKKKAVLFWIYGGGFNIGSANSAVYDGSVLADENDVVVVSINYRTNIFGFSAAPGQPANVGLLDQRLALEWTRDNIQRFGGDPSRITVFGQSAGGMSVDFLAYSYPDDPIAHALIAHSGVASTRIGLEVNGSTIRQTWFNVSSGLGCGGAEAGDATVECMRAKDQDEILAAIEDLGTSALLGVFTPYGDGVVLPEDISAEAKAGNFAKLPFMTGNTDNEAGFFLITALAYSNLTMTQVAALPMDLIRPIGDLLTAITFTCPAADAAGFRAKQGVPAWRYRYYGGDYANTEIFPVGSAYHTSELPIVFGTAASVSGVADSPVEAKEAAYIRDAWATFAKDPTSGLSTKFGWPKYNAWTQSLVQLGAVGQTKAKFAFNWQTDGICDLVVNLGSLSGDLSGGLTGLLAGLTNGGSSSSSSSSGLSGLSGLLSGSNSGDQSSILSLLKALQK